MTKLLRATRPPTHFDAPSTDPRDARRHLLAEGAHVDCVICDEIMPFLTGTELARELAERPGTPPFLLISGYAPSAAEPPPANVRARLPKPLSADALLAALARASSAETTFLPNPPPTVGS